MLLCHILFILIHYKYINIYLDWILHWKMLLLGTSGFKPETKKNWEIILQYFCCLGLCSWRAPWVLRGVKTKSHLKIHSLLMLTLKFSGLWSFGFLEVHLVAFLVQSNNFLKRFRLWSYWGKGGMGWSILLGFFNLLIFEVIDFQLKPNFLGLCST